MSKRKETDLSEFTRQCPITGEPMRSLFTQKIMNKYLVRYFFSDASGILQTETPYWLDEAYAVAISDLDTGLVSRNLRNRKRLAPLLLHLFQRNDTFLDIAGGYGLLARLMRDLGFDFYTTDKYCDNILAKSFEPPPNFKAQALCAFEVLEHVENPLKFIEENMVKYQSDTFIFSTQTFDNNAIPDKNWWYYSFEIGKHITFCQPRTFQKIAEKLGANYHRIDSSFHVISRKHIQKWMMRILRSGKLLDVFYNFYVRRKMSSYSRTWDDYHLVKKKI